MEGRIRGGRLRRREMESEDVTSSFSSLRSEYAAPNRVVDSSCMVPQMSHIRHFLNSNNDKKMQLRTHARFIETRKQLSPPQTCSTAYSKHPEKKLHTGIQSELRAQGTKIRENQGFGGDFRN